MITMTNTIEGILQRFSKKERKLILQNAWDACCDGETLKWIEGSIGCDPWDGKHEDLREKIELDMVLGVVNGYLQGEEL